MEFVVSSIQGFKAVVWELHHLIDLCSCSPSPFALPYLVVLKIPILAKESVQETTHHFSRKMGK